MVAEAVLGGLNLVSGLTGGSGNIFSDLFGPKQPSPEELAAAADPYRPYRSAAAQQLNALMADPASVQNMPGFKAELDMGSQVLNQRLAQRGQTGSGAEMMALQELGMTHQNRFFNDQFNRLATLSGASTTAGAGGQAAAEGMMNNYNQATQNVNQSGGMFLNGLMGTNWNSVGSSLGNLFNSGSGVNNGL